MKLKLVHQQDLAYFVSVSSHPIGVSVLIANQVEVFILFYSYQVRILCQIYIFDVIGNSRKEKFRGKSK